MKPRPLVVTIVLLVLMGLPEMISARRFGHAKTQLQSATALLTQTARDAQEILALRGREERIGLAERPTQDVIAQVNAVLATIGVPTQRLKNLAPEADAAIGSGQTVGPHYRRQSLRLVLEDLSVAEIGAFLAAWQQSPGGTAWTPSRIELLHNRTSSGSVGGRYDLTILISAIYVAENS